MTRIGQFLRRFRRDETGSGTIEFVLLMPMMLAFCLSTIELGVLLTNQVMLDRGIDLATRQVRLGTLFPLGNNNPEDLHELLRDEICDGALILRDCRNQLKLEMVPANPRNWRAMSMNADCINREDDTPLNLTFTAGQQNELVILRACVLYDPFFPTTGLGSTLPRRPGGGFALVSTTSYVVEPR